MSSFHVPVYATGLFSLKVAFAALVSLLNANKGRQMILVVVLSQNGLLEYEIIAHGTFIRLPMPNGGMET